MRKLSISVVFLPAELRPDQLTGRSVAVFDVLRATTTIAAALAAGVCRVRLFGSTDEAAAAAGRATGPRLLAGEQRCLPPRGFDRGNSPGAFTPADAGRELYFATTNGTRALLAASKARRVITGALVNAAATARELACHDDDILLLCAGTDGEVAMEDVLGCGAVVASLIAAGGAEAADDAAGIAAAVFQACRRDLPTALRQTQGGRNVIAAGLAGDIDFAARLDALPVVGILDPEQMSIEPRLPS
jgi:2-phosphosulfolactate phosphatase